METRLIKDRNHGAQGQLIFVLYAVLTAIVYILPYTKLRIPYILAASLMLVSLPLLLLRQRDLVRYTVLLLGTSFILFMGYLLFCDFPLSVAMNELIRNVRFFLPVLWGCYAIRYCTSKQKGFLLACIFIVVFIILINTLQALAADPWIARMLAQGTSTSSNQLNAYRLRNVGGFEFSYMMGIITLCFVWLALNASKRWVKIAGVILTILGFYYILQCQYTTLLLLTFLGTVLLLFRRARSWKVRILLLIGCVALIIGFVPLLYYLSDLFAGSLLSSKFLQIAEAFTNQDVNELGRRPELIAQSLQDWLKSPIFGGYYEGGDYQNSNAHSLVFSILGQNGVIGIGLWSWIFARSWKTVRRVMEEKTLSPELFDIAMVFLLALSFLNPIGYVFEVTIAVFLIVPLWVSFHMGRQPQEKGGKDSFTMDNHKGMVRKRNA